VFKALVVVEFGVVKGD